MGSFLWAKRIFLKGLLVWVVLYMLLSPAVLYAEQEANDSIGWEEKLVPDLNMDEIDRYISKLDSEIKEVTPEIDFKQLVYKISKNEISLKPQDVIRDVMSYIYREVVANTALLGKLVILAIICAILQNLVSAFERGTTGNLTYMVTYMVLATLAIGSFTVAVDSAREVIDKMVTFMQAILPVLLTMLVAVGGFTAAAIYQPMLFTSITLIATVIRDVILPMILFSAILVLVSNLSTKFKITNLAGLIRTVAMGLLGFMTTVFLGMLAIQGVAGAVGDSVMLRTAKFATDAFVPVVGGMFSDALEAIVSSSLLIKNAVGIAGIMVILITILNPLIKIICMALIFKLAGAIIQPVDDSQIVNCLNDLGNSLFLVFAVVATVGLLFFFIITILVAVGNITVMLR